MERSGRFQGRRANRVVSGAGSSCDTCGCPTARLSRARAEPERVRGAARGCPVTRRPLREQPQHGWGSGAAGAGGALPLLLRPALRLVCRPLFGCFALRACQRFWQLELGLLSDLSVVLLTMHRHLWIFSCCAVL